jgi:hypothetical protein
MSNFSDKKLDVVNLWLDQLAQSQIIVYYLYMETSVSLHLLLTPRLFPLVKVMMLSDQPSELAEVHLNTLVDWLIAYAKRAYGVQIPEIESLSLNQKILQQMTTGLGL